MDSGPRYHSKFPNVALTRSTANRTDLICDVTEQPVKLGDVLWSNRDQDIDIVEQAMPEYDVRFHPKFPGVPLVKAVITAAEEGKWVCDVTGTPARAGDVIWSNRDQDLDVLNIAFQSAAPPTGGLATVTPGAYDSGHTNLRRQKPGKPLSAIDALNQTGMELLLTVLEASKNVFVSPLSIGLALSMTANGAQGETLKGMMRALCTEELGGLAPLNDQMRALTSLLNSSDTRVNFHLANSLWSRNLLETFVAVCASAYNAEAINQAPDASAINKWCAEKTQNKIDSVVSPPLDPQGAVLVNALYFKGEWKTKFDASCTRPAEFFNASGDRLNCQMMTAKGEKSKFAYQETDTYQVACLPYGDNGEYSAMIVLPRRDSSPTLSMGRGSGDRVAGAACNPRPATLPEVLMDLTTEWKDSLQWVKGNLQFPRFKVESGMELGPLLQARGMQLAFSGGADFGAMSTVPLFISKVIHKTFVEVNEEGTEAAAVTAVVMSRCIARPEPSFTMICDRPFLFFIRHDRTKAIIFAGVVKEPE